MDVLEHIADKYGFPIAVMVWMFWRDYKFMTMLGKKLQILIDLLGVVAAKRESE
jgi:hypothetical protein